MNRGTLHIAFWTVYMVQDILLALTWYGPAMGHISNGHLLWMAFRGAAGILLPKMLLTYYLLEVTVPQVMSGKGVVSPWKMIGSVFAVSAISVFLYRAVSYYYTFPYVYKNRVTQKYLLDIPTVLVAIMDIGFIAGLAVAIKFVRIQLQARLREKTLLKEKLETELKFLRNQINPHFLLNTLNNIYALARKGSEETAEVVLRLSELLQFMLYQSGGKFITLRDEIKVLEGYLELEMIRYNERLSVSLNKETDNDSYLISPLLLLPFVENAFKHGVSETRFESIINIDMNVRGGVLRFMIENSYDGCIDGSRDVGAGNRSLNIGLNNVRRQLELSYRDYTLDVRADNQLFTVNLMLNLESHVEI